jgi:hypothetical protein
MLHENLDEQTSFELERREISTRKLDHNCILINVCAGGYGGDTRNWDEHSRKRLSEMRKGSGSYWFGKNRNRETVEKGEKTKRERGSHTRYWTGKTRDPELIKKLVEASHTPEAIAKSVATRSLDNFGWNNADERRNNLSEKMNGYDFGPEHGEKISKAKKGKPNGLLGRKISEETKAKMSEAAIGRVYGKEITDKAKATKLARGNMTLKARAVRCKETGEIFRCAKEVSLKLFEGKGEKVIQQCCTGSKPSYRGYRFEYAL